MSEGEEERSAHNEPGRLDERATEDDAVTISNEHPGEGDDDDADLDSDSGYTGSVGYAASTQSLTASVLEYQYHNGRRYNAFRHGNYYMPNDEKEQDFMDLFHHVCLLLLDGDLYCAPVQEPRHILDVGTGTGIWPMDIADKFTEAEVPSWAPPNLQYIIDDCEDDWQFPQRFDFIHARNLAGSLRDWPRFLRQAYDSMAPGGWIEIAAIGFPCTARDEGFSTDSSALQLNTLLRQATESSGRILDINSQMKDLFLEAGFTQVEQIVRTVPASKWMTDRRSREIAKYNQPLLCGEIEGTTSFLFSRQLGWSEGAIQVFLASVRSEYMDKNMKIYQDMTWTFGRRPSTV